jgi:hypothetical protein
MRTKDIIAESESKIKSALQSLAKPYPEVVYAMLVGREYILHFVQSGGTGEWEEDLKKVDAAIIAAVQ